MTNFSIFQSKKLIVQVQTLPINVCRSGNFNSRKMKIVNFQKFSKEYFVIFIGLRFLKYSLAPYTLYKANEYFKKRCSKYINSLFLLFVSNSQEKYLKIGMRILKKSRCEKSFYSVQKNR